jgi:hypothetical protein
MCSACEEAASALDFHVSLPDIGHPWHSRSRRIKPALAFQATADPLRPADRYTQVEADHRYFHAANHSIYVL